MTHILPVYDHYFSPVVVQPDKTQFSVYLAEVCPLPLIPPALVQILSAHQHLSNSAVSKVVNSPLRSFSVAEKILGLKEHSYIACVLGGQ